MGRDQPGTYDLSWSPPPDRVDAAGKVIGAIPPEPNNWGRWGAGDQRGTANLIIPDIVARAGSLIRSGRTYSLAIPIEPEAPVHRTRPKAMRLNTLADACAGERRHEFFLTAQPL